MLHSIDRVLGPVTWLVAAFAVAVLLVGPQLIGAEKPPPTPQQAATVAADGKTVFTGSCGSCHTLADAGASGQVGPNLDDSTLDVAAITAQVENGGGGMPSFKGTLQPDQIQAVADYVTAARGS
jgi:mono/diheme cytochrome c family protein